MPRITTDDYWSINGVSLETTAWGISEIGGSLDGAPAYRSSPPTLPFRAGTVWIPRIPASRTITFPMWVTNRDDYGVPADAAQLEQNWRQLKNLFWGSGDQQLEITKRWNGGADSATGYGVFAGGLEPTNFAQMAYRFTVDIYMDDPFFYESERALGTFTVGTHDITGDIVGDAPSPKYSVRATGPLTSSAVILKEGSTVLSRVDYPSSISTSNYIDVEFPEFTVTQTGSYLKNTIAYYNQWLSLVPSATSVQVTGSGGGSVSIAYSPARL